MILWSAWTIALVLACAGADMPVIVRSFILAIMVPPLAGTIRRVVALRGPRALRAVEWNEAGGFVVRVGDPGRRLPASPGAGCLRYGARLWILRFDTPEGVLMAVVDATSLDPPAVRTLCRRLEARQRT